MYVILNDHWDGGWWGMFGSESKETAAFAMEAYQGMWRQIAEYFRDYSDYVIFESANEELGALTGKLGNIPGITVKSALTGKKTRKDNME